MSELLKALQNLPPQKVKKHYVTIQGKQYQVGLQKKLEVMRNGEENYMIKPAKFGPEIILKPQTRPKTQYPVLKTVTKGYFFHDGDIHWPNAVAEGGEAWLIERE
jgi:hypothetical protein